MAVRRTGKRAADVLAGVAEELERGWSPGLTVLTGDDLFRLDEAQRRLLHALAPPEESQLTVTAFGQEQVDVSTLVSAARSIGMFSSRRVVLLRELKALDGDPAPLVAYAKSPPDDSFLIVRAPEIDLRRKLHKALASAGRVLTFATPARPTAQDLLSEVRALARRKGLTIAPDAAVFLAEVAAGDLYRLDSELEKLAVWKGQERSGTVTLEEVRSVAAGSHVLSGWEVADAVLERDPRAAWAAVAQLVAAGEEPLRILGGVAWRARVMLQAKALLEKGEPPRRVIEVTRAWQWRDRLLAGLKRYSLDELREFPAHLLAADRALKSSRLDGGTILESLVEKLTAGGRPAPEVRR